MTKSDVMKEFLKKTVIPVVVALFLFSMFSRIFVENGAPDTCDGAPAPPHLVGSRFGRHPY